MEFTTYIDSDIILLLPFGVYGHFPLISKQFIHLVVYHKSFNKESQLLSNGPHF